MATRALSLLPTRHGGSRSRLLAATQLQPRRERAAEYFLELVRLRSLSAAHPPVPHRCVEILRLLFPGYCFTGIELQCMTCASIQASHRSGLYAGAANYLRPSLVTTNARSACSDWLRRTASARPSQPLRLAPPCASFSQLCRASSSNEVCRTAFAAYFSAVSASS